MSDNLINLRMARKKKQRQTKRKNGDTNAVLFGRTKEQKRLDAFEKSALDKRVQQHKRDTSSDA